MKQITEASMPIAQVAINKFFFYVWNFHAVDSGVCTRDEKTGRTIAHYVPEVIMKADWTESANHIVKKFLYYQNKYDYEAAFMRFYAELDGTNKKAMLRWIMENYHDEQELHF